eukprot:scaffold57640_cov74-Phaeocystis_antarctica.AAC.3
MACAILCVQECWHGRSCKPLPLLPGCTGADCRTARGKTPGVLTGPCWQCHNSLPWPPGTWHLGSWLRCALRQAAEPPTGPNTVQPIPGEVASAVRYWRWLQCHGVRWTAARAAAPALADATAGWELWRLYEQRLQLVVPAGGAPFRAPAGWIGGYVRLERGGGAGGVNGVAPDLIVGGGAAGAYGGVNGVGPDASANGLGCPLREGRPAEDLLPPRGRRVVTTAPDALAGACGDLPDAMWSDTCAAARRSAAAAANLGACVRACGGCAACRHVSWWPAHEGAARCGWFRSCDLARLQGSGDAMTSSL